MSNPYKFKYWHGPQSKYFDPFHHYRSNQPVSYWTQNQINESRQHMAKAKQHVMKNARVHHAANEFKFRFRRYMAKKKADEARMKQIALRAKPFMKSKAAVNRFKQRLKQKLTMAQRIQINRNRALALQRRRKFIDLTR